MKSSLRSLALVLLATVPLAGCSDIDDSNFLSGDVGDRVVITAAFENGSGLATIENLRVSWDGEKLQDLVLSPAAAQVSVYTTKFGRERGSHRLSFQIRGQTSSPNSYRITGLEVTSYASVWTVRQSLELEPRTALLETNGVITYTFSLD